MGLDAPSMSWQFVWPHVAERPTLAGNTPPPPVPLPGFDIFGHRRNRWIDGVNQAWDVFGFRIYAAWGRFYDEILMQQIPRPQRRSRVTTGMVFGMYRPSDRNYCICEVTSIENPEVNVSGVRILASVRAVKHWVSRWRRGLRVLRKRHASMVLAHRLPEAPEITMHVHAFL